MRSGPLSAARRMAAPALALLLASCAADLGHLATPVNLPETPKQAEVTPAIREHNRILAAYGGAYQDARLESLITQTVDRLGAASQRPRLRSQVTIPNSPANN